jgi:hypothetical protein
MPGTSPCGELHKRYPSKPPFELLRKKPIISRPYSEEERASSVLAIVATLNLETIPRHQPASLPPWIGASIAILGDIDWPAVCQLAIRKQHTALEGASELPVALVRDKPSDLAGWLET